ncbi:MAG: argininosuccinate lyase [Nitrospirae bacterium]|nr:argininosuccinate lyase [Nitrospirota bacterium]
MKKPWAGRFTEKTEKIVEGFTSSISFDKRLWEYDIDGSIAHARMLGKQKIISRRDMELIIRGLDKIRDEIRNNKFKFRDELEDIHMNIEHALINKIGSAGGKLHTARSRNDQTALDLRLFMREEISGILKLITSFQRVLLNIAERHVDTPMPGYTHLQRAQPVLLSHHLLAYLEMLERDKARFNDCLKRVNILPLGSAALAGTTLPIDRKYAAGLLSFPAISGNSMDAVSDRDFVIEFLSASGLLMAHLSRLAEELVLWSSAEFGFIELPDAYSTGSSIMPQKKNPDVPELIRGKTGRVFGSLIAMLTVLKGLPLSYNRDLQEDKEPVFDATDTVKSCLSVLIKMMPEIKFKKNVLRNAADADFSTATDIAEYLVKKGIPFRNAHETAGRIVRYCIRKNKMLAELSLKEFKDFSKLIGKDIFNCLTVQESVNKKTSYGGTSKKNVLAAFKKFKKLLK